MHFLWLPVKDELMQQLAYQCRLSYYTPIIITPTHILNTDSSNPACVITKTGTDDVIGSVHELPSDLDTTDNKWVTINLINVISRNFFFLLFLHDKFTQLVMLSPHECWWATKLKHCAMMQHQWWIMQGYLECKWILRTMFYHLILHTHMIWEGYSMHTLLFSRPRWQGHCTKTKTWTNYSKQL